MPTPKKFVNQAIEMETFFEDEEPTYREFMRYPPFDSLMNEEFSLQNMINAYREGRIVFHTKKSPASGRKCNFFTKDWPNTVFTIYNSSVTTYDELDPTTLEENTHEALMNVKLKNLNQNQTFSVIICENLTLEQESAFSSFIAKVLYEGVSKQQGDDGKQYLRVKIYNDYHTLLTTSYLKIYQPFNTKFPESLIKKLNEMFDNQKV
jgi:hypothetical protein